MSNGKYHCASAFVYAFLGAIMGLCIGQVANKDWVKYDKDGVKAKGGLWEFCVKVNGSEDCERHWDRDDWDDQSKCYFFGGQRLAIFFFGGGRGDVGVLCQHEWI